jgi:hypothetical protein
MSLKQVEIDLPLGLEHCFENESVSLGILEAGKAALFCFIEQSWKEKALQ